MLKRKVRKDAVICAQKEVIQAQDVLIEWLLERVQEAPSQAATTETRIPSEVCNGHD